MIEISQMYKSRYVYSKGYNNWMILILQKVRKNQGFRAIHIVEMFSFPQKNMNPEYNFQFLNINKYNETNIVEP